MSIRRASLGKRVFLKATVAAALTASIPIGVTLVTAQEVNAPTYEVVSIKPAPPNMPAGGGSLSGSGIQYTADGLRASSTVAALIQSAYGVEADRIRGAQNWVTSEKFVIEAKLESSVADQMNKLSPEELDVARQRMLQALLADRFKLTVRIESKELPVYELVIAKDGPKIREAKHGETYADGYADAIKARDGRALGGDMMVGFGTTGTVRGQGVPISTLVQGLSRFLGRPVVDKTGLTGKYDFVLRYATDIQEHAPSGGVSDGSAPATASDPGAPSIFTAIQEQLGLKLEAKKDPLAVIVIDRVERPSGN